jgi:CHAT domain-containing protein/uncharacterized protein HemY
MLRPKTRLFVAAIVVLLVSLTAVGQDAAVTAGRYFGALKAAAAQESRTNDLATALAAAQTESERAALVARNKDLLTAELVRLLFSHGEGLTHTHEYERALAVYNIALKIAEQGGDRSAMAHILGNIGLTLWQVGDYTQALGSYHRSMALLEALGDQPGVVLMLYNLGMVHASQGNYELALEYNRKYLVVAESLGNKAMIARVMPSIGAIYHAQGNYIKAMEYYQKAVALFKEVGDEGGVAAALLDIAGVYTAQNDFALALDYEQKALAISEGAFKKIPGTDTEQPSRFAAGILLDIGIIYGRQAQYARALEFLLRSLAMAEALKNRAMVTDTLGNIGQIYLLQGNYVKAMEAFRQAMKLKEEAGDKESLAQLLGRAGGAYDAQGNHDEALKFASRSAELARQLGSPTTLWYARMVAGKAYQALGQQEQARHALEEAITTIENMRTQVAGGEQAEESFFEDKVLPYHLMAGLLITQNEPFEALRYAERSKARVLLDVVRNGKGDITKDMTAQEREEERRFNSGLVALNTQISNMAQQTQPNAAHLAGLRAQLEKTRLEYEAFQTNLYTAHPRLKIQRGEAQPIRLEEVAELLPDDQSAALEFMLTGDKTYLFVLTRSNDGGRADLQVYTLAVKAADVRERAERFRQQLAEDDLDFQPSARALYDLLLKPAQSQLQNKTTLVIVPDGALWNLPFQALVSAAGRYLLEEHAILYAPSLTVLREIVRVRPAKHPQSQPTLLAFGNPTVSKQTVEGVRRVSLDEKLEPLPEAEKQVNALARLYGLSQSKVYTGADAREDRVKREAAGYRILQFATHGILNNGSPMYSHLVLARAEGDSNEDGLLEAREMMKLDLHAEMVVLSACETGRGRIGAGEGLIGMSWALFVAGSTTTVASQWKVESASTTELMLEFHRNLKSGVDDTDTRMTRARALQQAALKLMRDVRYAHPFYWAGFVMLGNGF